jgi:hypothetical protein
MNHGWVGIHDATDRSIRLGGEQVLYCDESHEPIAMTNGKLRDAVKSRPDERFTRFRCESLRREARDVGREVLSR